MWLLFKASNLLRNKAVYSQNKYYKKNSFFVGYGQEWLSQNEVKPDFLHIS